VGFVLLVGDGGRKRLLKLQSKFIVIAVLQARGTLIEAILEGTKAC
jgi:hypothetical protein